MGAGCSIHNIICNILSNQVSNLVRRGHCAGPPCALVHARLYSGNGRLVSFDGTFGRRRARFKRRRLSIESKALANSGAFAINTSQ